MRDTAIVLRRELQSYFLSPIAYVFGALFLFVQLTWFSRGALQHGSPASVGGFFAALPLVLMLFVPPLTMRLWAEERKLGTLELLLTFPVRTSSLIGGKFLAAVAYLGALLLLTLVLPLLVDSYGDLDWGPVVAGYVGSVLLAASYVAVGMFYSSVTRDQIVALLASLVTLGLFTMLGLPTVLAMFRGVGLPLWLVEALGATSPFTYFQSIARGVFDTRDLVYYVVFCAFWLHLNVLVLRGRRQNG